MSHDVQLTRIKSECVFISSTFPKDTFQEILDNPILKRALIGSLHLITRSLPRDVFRRKIEYYSSFKDLKSHLIRSISDSEYIFDDKKLYHFLNLALPKALESIEKLL